MTNPDELERLARAATPGPWEWEDRDLLNPTIREGHKRVIKDEPYEGQWIDPDGSNAAFIAAANPATILALLSANREMREEIEAASTHLLLAGNWLREMGDDGQRANTLLEASGKARSALSTKED